MIKLKGFTPLLDTLVSEYGIMRAAIFGRVWRYCQMSENSCFSSKETIARELNISERTVFRHLQALCDDGYLNDQTPQLRNKPHTYTDTGKAYLEIGMTQSHTTTPHYDTESYQKPPTMTESHSHYDRESREESNKKEIKDKKENEEMSCSKIWEEISFQLGVYLPAVEKNILFGEAILSKENGHYRLTHPDSSRLQLIKTRLGNQIERELIARVGETELRIE